MVLVDTSVWVSYLKDGNAELAKLLNGGGVLCHPFIIGELSLGNLKEREIILSYLKLLPMSVEAEYEEVLLFIENSRLMGKGIGYVDAHLLASAVLTDVPVWTFDKKLAQAADSLNIRYTVP